MRSFIPVLHDSISGIWWQESCFSKILSFSTKKIPQIFVGVDTSQPQPTAGSNSTSPLFKVQLPCPQIASRLCVYGQMPASNGLLQTWHSQGYHLSEESNQPRFKQGSLYFQLFHFGIQRNYWCTDLREKVRSFRWNRIIEQDCPELVPRPAASIWELIKNAHSQALPRSDSGFPGKDPGSVFSRWYVHRPKSEMHFCSSLTI